MSRARTWTIQSKPLLFKIRDRLTWLFLNVNCFDGTYCRIGEYFLATHAHRLEDGSFESIKITINLTNGHGPNLVSRANHSPEPQSVSPGSEARTSGRRVTYRFYRLFQAFWFSATFNLYLVFTTYLTSSDLELERFIEMVSTRNHPRAFPPPLPASPASPTKSSRASSAETALSTRPVSELKGVWAHTPSNFTIIWLAISLPLVIWDTAYGSRPS